MKIHAWLLFALLTVSAFSLATALQPRTLAWAEGKDSDNLMQVLLGDGRQVLANHMFVQADVYFHSGYYPSVFDQTSAPTNAQHMTHEDVKGDAAGHDPDHEGESAGHHEEEEHEKAMSFQTHPMDWVERFGRRFAITEHTHLSNGKEREMLPWLRLSAALDPHRVETYTVASYWLRGRLGKPKEAEQFLRDGLAANPSSYDILFELGRLYHENYHDNGRARNVWESAMRRWMEVEARKPDPDLQALGRITSRLARIEEDDGHYARAIELLQIAISHKATPSVDALSEKIERLRARMNEGAAKKG